MLQNCRGTRGRTLPIKVVETLGWGGGRGREKVGFPRGQEQKLLTFK